MWTGPIHNQEFVEQMLAHVEEHATDFKTADRIKGMVTVAKHVRQMLRPVVLSFRVLIERAPTGIARALVLYSDSDRRQLQLHFTTLESSSVSAFESRATVRAEMANQAEFERGFQLCTTSRRLQSFSLARLRRFTQD